VKNIEHFYKTIKAKDVEIYFELSTDNDLKIKAFNIKDPDGNFLQFVERLS
jgi:hypothetical protein